MTGRAFVVGVGMTKFEKPGSRAWDYPDMALEAGTAALADAGIPYTAVQEAYAGYVYGDSTSGQRALYQLGLTGIPVINVNNNCATGSSALFLARRAVTAGLVDCAMAIGFERMEKGSLGIKFPDRASPGEQHFTQMAGKRGFGSSPPASQLFGNAGIEYMERYDVKPDVFARIAEKNHRHSVNNPNSQFRDEYTLQDILDSPMVFDPMTRLQCCPTSDGGAATIVASERFVREHGLEDRAIEIVAQSLVSDPESVFSGSDMDLVGYGMTRAGADKVYAESGLGPEDVDVIELHDCFSANELITYDGLRLCAEGGAGELINSGAVTYGGSVVINPSGGLISKGHPLGATGLAQTAELTWQLRGTAGPRQVDGAKVALAHNLGIGGAAVVTMFRSGTLA